MFFAQKYRAEKSKFCSPVCSQKSRDEGKSSDAMKIRKSPEYKQWRLSVFRRDGFRCVLCGVKSGNGSTVILNADHIKPFSSYPELRFDLNNGRTLCVPCHKSTPSYGRPKKVKTEA